jgi:hypothetical protein
MKCTDCIARKPIIHAFDAGCTTFFTTAAAGSAEADKLAEHMTGLRKPVPQLSRDTPSFGGIPVSGKPFRKLLTSSNM